MRAASRANSSTSIGFGRNASTPGGRFASEISAALIAITGISLRVRLFFRLSQNAQRLMDALLREHPQYTRELRANTFLLEPSRTREFERAMAELQQGLWVVKSEERYEPTFSYRWELLEDWLPDLVAEGRRLSRAAALDRLIARYTGGAVFTSATRLRRLFGVPAAEIAASVARLVRAHALHDVAVGDWPGRWLVRAPAPPRR